MNSSRLWCPVTASPSGYWLRATLHLTHVRHTVNLTGGCGPLPSIQLPSLVGVAHYRPYDYRWWAWQAASCILYTKSCIVHTAYCVLHSAHCTLHTAHYTPHTAHYILHTPHCILHTAPRTLHTTPCKLHPAHCNLNTEIPRTVRCTLTNCIPHTEY